MSSLRKVILFYLFCFCPQIQGGSDERKFKRNDYSKPTALDYSKLSGRWYLYMDNRSAAIRDNTYGEFEILSDGRLVNVLYRYFPDLEECRSTSLMFKPITPDIPQKEAMTFEVTRMSTNEKLGTQTVLFIDDDPKRGFVIMHQKTHIDSYLVTTRSKHPSNQIRAIETALTNLDLDPKKFNVKSADYGMILNENTMGFVTLSPRR